MSDSNAGVNPHEQSDDETSLPSGNVGIPRGIAALLRARGTGTHIYGRTVLPEELERFEAELQRIQEEKRLNREREAEPRRQSGQAQEQADTPCNQGPERFIGPNRSDDIGKDENRPGRGL